jgi:acyl carrier protein
VTLNGLGDRIEEFIRDQFAIAPSDKRFNRSVPLFEHGYVDSMGVVELLAFLKEEFGVAIPDHELLSDDFSTIDGIAALVDRLRRDVSRQSA